MTYSGVDVLTRDPAFIGRVSACVTEQANLTYKNDTNPANAAMALDAMRGGPSLSAFNKFVAGSPGLADKATTAGGLDQTLIVDGDILAAVQADWTTVSSLYFDSKGNRVA